MASYGSMLAILAFLGIRISVSWPYFAGLALAGAMMLYHWRLIRGRTREGCFRAFMHNNWVGGAIFAGIVASYPEAWPWR
jgi:4-hydroxybenzoate polyprenyltransferase